MHIHSNLSANWNEQKRSQIFYLLNHTSIFDDIRLSHNGFSYCDSKKNGRDKEYETHKDNEEERRIDLKGLSTCEIDSPPVMIRNCSFYMSHFKDCNFKNVIFRNVDFSQCMFESCYLRNAKFVDCVLIGTKFINSELQGAEINNSVLRHLKMNNCYVSENLFKTFRTDTKNMPHLNEHKSKKEIYTQVKANCYNFGDYDKANHFKRLEVLESIEHEKCNKRYLHWATKLIIAKITGFGCNPVHTIIFSLINIIIFSLFFISTGFKDTSLNKDLTFSAQQSPSEILSYFLKGLYLSTTLFTNFGNKVLTPFDSWGSYLLMLTESIMGYFCLSAFIVILFNKYYRG